MFNQSLARFVANKSRQAAMTLQNVAVAATLGLWYIALRYRMLISA